MIAAQHAALAHRGLRPAAELAANRGHGDRLKYLAGCRCAECRKANSSYENERQKARARGEGNGIVSADKARAHILDLAKINVGRNAVADASDVAKSIVCDIRSGKKTRIRAETERRILAVTKDAAADRALIPATETWEYLNKLLADGHSKALLSKLLGYRAPALQIKKTQVTVRTAYQVKRLYEEMRSVCAKGTKRLLRLLREEGYTQSRIECELSGLALAAGRETPTLNIGEKLPKRDADLIERLYKQLTE